MIPRSRDLLVAACRDMRPVLAVIALFFLAFVAGRWSATATSTHALLAGLLALGAVGLLIGWIYVLRGDA